MNRIQTRISDLWLAVVLLCLCCLPSIATAVEPAVIEAQAKRIATVDKVAPSVVAIFSADGGGGGSGVLISADGYALTNYHVTSGAGDFMKCGLNDGELYDAVIVGIDPTGDVALIKLLGRDDFPVAVMGDSDTVEVGDWAYAMGNPFLLATDFSPTVTYGIVSGVRRYQYPAGTFLEYADCIQIDTSINPGNSGGPLFNEAGEIIGINGRGSFEKRGRVNSGAGYAISINQIKRFIDHLKSGRIVDHASLGATVSTSDSGAVEVSGILPISEAFRRGLREGDEIVSFANRPIGSVNQFKNVLAIYPKGWKVPLVYRRDQQKHEIFPRLSGLHRQSELEKLDARPQMPPPDRRPGDEDDDPEAPREKPKQDKPKLPFHLPKPPSAPAEYKHMLVKKPGFVNYYFNELKQKELMQVLADFGDFKGKSGRWLLSGQFAAGPTIELSLLGEQAAYRSVSDVGVILGLLVMEDPLSYGDPPGSGGTLMAFSLFRQLLISGDEDFDEFYYLGSEPLDGNGPQVDVLTTLSHGVASRWYFSKAERKLVGFDTYITEYDDSLSIRILEVSSFDNVIFPKSVTMQHGDQPVRTIIFESVRMEAEKTLDTETP